jgi:hypothetical protein
MGGVVELLRIGDVMWGGVLVRLPDYSRHSERRGQEEDEHESDLGEWIDV